MEQFGKRTLCSFIDEDDRSSSQDHQFSPPRPSSSSIILPPPSPESPWILSPHQTPSSPSPSPSILYHCIASLHRQQGNILSVAVSKGLIFTGSDSPRIRAWRSPDCLERGHLRSSSGEVRSILAYGNFLFTTHKDHRVRVWNVTAANSAAFRCKKIATLPKRSRAFFTFRKTGVLHKDCVSCLAYYHADGLLYTGSWDRTVRAWRVYDGRCVDSFRAHEDCLNSIVVNQSDGCVFTCSSDGSVKIWRRVYGQSSHTLTMTLKFQPSPVNALALSGGFLYSGSSDGFINFWEKEKFSSRFNHGGFLQGHRFSVLCLATVERLIFSGSEDTTIRVWRREEGSCVHECLAVVDAHRGPVRCLAAAMEVEKVVMGYLVYSGSLDRTFKVWRVKVLPEEENKKDGNWSVSMSVPEQEPEPKSEQGRGELKVKIMEYEMSPVLSPSWVEKKLHQGNNHPFS